MTVVINKYETELKNVINHTEFTEQDVFNFELSPYSVEFKNTFDFSKEALNLAIKYGVNKSLIFFYNDFSVNARAGNSNGYNIICINAGLQIWTIKNLLEKNEIHEILKSIYFKAVEYLDNSINVLMYQLTMHFTFYHELAHLIQKSKYLTTYLSERPEKLETFDLTKHKLEIDADSFSAISIASHIQQYALKHFDEDLDSAIMESLIEIFCTSTLLYFLSFQSNNLKIYYYETSHPHPMFRILNIILTITHYLQQSDELAGRNIIIDHKKVFKTTIQITLLIEGKVFGTLKTKKFENFLETEMTNIKEYFLKVKDFNLIDFKSAINVWNDCVKNNNVA